jgi:chromosomal replication initiation ATPase DnaA
VNRAQLALDLPHRSALGAEDFLVSACNRSAVRLIDAWPDWPGRIQLLIGPAASGKTHLVRVWQARSQAEALSPEHLELPGEAVQDGAAWVIEDADRAPVNEKKLFHVINFAAEKRLFLLLTARDAPIRWGVGLPDLLSRLNGLPSVQIGPPDDMLLKTVILKHFSDRQLDVEPKVLEFLALHVERSLEAAARAVDAVDREALASGRKISRQLVAEALRSVAAD